MTTKELREKRAALAKQIQEKREAFNKDGKWADAAAEANWKQVNADYDALTAQISMNERADAVEAEQRTAAASAESRGTATPGRDDTTKPESREAQASEEDRSACMAAWCLAQYDEDIPERQREACERMHFNPNRRSLTINLSPTHEMRGLQRAFRSAGEGRAIERALEYRTPMATFPGAVGGGLIPASFVRSLEVNMLAFGGMRQSSEILATSTGEPMTWPTADDTTNTGVQVGENTTVDNSGSGGTPPAIAGVVWNAYTFSSQAILVPFALIQDSFIDLPGILGQMIGERLGRVTNTKYTTGTGAATPKGITFTAGSGVTGASTSAIAYDEIIRLEHSIDPAYRNGAGYMLHDSILLAVRLLKDGQGRYLWQDNANSGVPSTLNGKPYTINQDMASSVSSGAKTIIFGQLNKYKIRTVGTMRLYRLQERYRDKDQDGFIGMIREDGNQLTAGTNPIKYLTH